MLGFIEGKVLETVQGQCVLAVEFPGGRIGYQISHPTRVQYQRSAEDARDRATTLSLWIHTQARADQNGVWELYGFLDHREREIFRSLISVNGVGPKLALSLLSGLEPGDLVNAIVEKLLARLTAISGVGKKTAERLVLELGEKWRDRFGGAPLQARCGTAGAHSEKFEELRLALAGLGYRPGDVEQVLTKLNQTVDAEKAATYSTQDWVRIALKVAAR